jgi:formylglycine-generating enzyme required for sulfatase activity
MTIASSKNLGINLFDLSSWRTGVDSYGTFEEMTIGSVVQRLRWIPPGYFDMGAPKNEVGRFPNEGPQHLVFISRGFWMFDTTCSQLLWRMVIGSNPSRFHGEDRPVEQVSWDDVHLFLEKINSYCSRIQFDLPTEAQWEYACRAGTRTAYNIGSKIRNTDAHYFVEGSDVDLRSRQGTVLVKSYSPNRLGLYQMHGNIWEWCKDGMRSYQLGAMTDPLGPVAEGVKRVVRGGSWGADARHLRTAYRSEYPPGASNGHLGFRCVCEPEST